ncbi:hypothetical protein IAT40_006854 [Kwoniella sp. CBS 6097]
MSLLAPQQPHTERASVVLPTVTCSSCAAPIPLSSLGEHVCIPPSTARAMPDRHAPRPSQITIPQARPSMSMQRSASANGPSPNSVRPPFAGPASAYPSPTELHVPRRPSAANLSPHDPSPNGYSAYPVPTKTPSPTNPFFPHPDQQQNGSMVHGLGMGVGQGESSPIIDTTSGGESGMAGVGRRAFAAAAWGVRAGVALASSAKNQVESHVQGTSSQLTAWPQPQPQAQHHTNSQTTPREPPLLPKVPLSGRQRSGPSPIFNARPEMHHSNSMPMEPSSSSSSHSPPRRSASAMSQRSAPNSPPRRGESVSSGGSHRQNESISQILRTRNPTAPAKSNTQGFFDKVKELHSRSNTASPTLGASMVRSGSGGSSSDRLVASPQPTTFELDDEYDDQHSALPWATPALGDSPVINRGANGRKPEATHHRYPTAGSEASSSSSSSRSGRWGANSGPESEEVVTPSQSLEILSERANGPVNRDDNAFRGYGNGMEGRDLLDQIGEEDEDDEGERVVFGTPTARNIKGDGYDSRIPNSHSTSTITSNRPYLPTTAPHSSPNRSRRPSAEGGKTHNHSHSHSGSTSSSSDLGSSGSGRRKKICVKCGDSVGGSKRFVERDGVVLCERDWKKLYLPSCRRCNLPIEKSAVSSSDGQLKGKWHRACFTCTRCDRPFEDDDFYVHGGKPWCQYHYHEENGTLCASGSCHQPIEGPSILTPGPNPQRFHPGHLRCDHRGGVSGAQNCRESMEEYYDVGGNRYCERHVGEATRAVDGSGRSMTMRAEKRRTRLVDLPVGGLGF